MHHTLRKQRERDREGEVSTKLLEHSALYDYLKCSNEFTVRYGQLASLLPTIIHGRWRRETLTSFYKMGDRRNLLKVSTPCSDDLYKGPTKSHYFQPDPSRSTFKGTVKVDGSG